MKVKALISLLSKYDQDLEVSVPCGHDSDDQFLYTDTVVAQEMVTSEAKGIDPDGTLRESEVPIIMILPADGPWAELFAALDDEDDK
ncbi:hypothetical protein LCGC14_0318410 [marine sediment metagenome]|uniref:Uncharacterized protein n=1 Tax=marine sediment metagenome TaxID=412755 RepID=A0A0F9TQF2_9ZZZZ